MRPFNTVSSCLLQKGAVLPLTLIILAILSILAMTLSQRAAGYLDTAVDYKKQWQAELTIHNAEQRVLLTLIAGDFKPGRIDIGNTRLPIYGKPYKLSNGVMVKVQDEAGILNILHARQKDVISLFRNLGYGTVSASLAAEAFAWQNPSSNYTSSDNARGFPYRSQDEFLELTQMKPELFNGRGHNALAIKDYLLAAGPGWLNYAAMPEVILRSVMSVKQEELQQINTLRERGRWRELEMMMRRLGMYGDGLEFTPSPNFVVNYEVDGFRAKGNYKLVTASHVLFEKRIWQFPDQDRF
ncbi:hypothetical protein [Motilimonas pumila]|uniref:General secretion pathway protein GspK n=1 Tax=Motilimonas pumila TaxID=2303987 RepID=A0A418YDX1_9GAMM|nr:hypothetical protein [Motilimonas pumila]RJG42729.1 hypothetical protein D1Z90_11605 [Motilimonas pumila]